MARLRHVNGATVVVPDEKVDTLVRAGFTVEPEKATKTARKSSSSKPSK